MIKGVKGLYLRFTLFVFLLLAIHSLLLEKSLPQIYTEAKPWFRPTKKQLIAQLEAKGVESKITQSLMRANIETISWVLAKIS